MKISYLFTFFILFLSTKSFAVDLKIEPIYGIERVQREFPLPARTQTTTFLGLRALYGTSIWTSNETFSNNNLDVTYIDRKALLGFRTYPLTSKAFGLFLRFGIRAQKNKREIKENGASRTEEDALVIDPYAGTGLSIVLANNFSLNAGATLVYNRDAQEESERFDTRYTFSFTIRAGNRRW